MIYGRLPTRSPDGAWSPTELAVKHVPMSIGHDGQVYGRNFNTPSEAMVRTADGFDTVDVGVDNSTGDEALVWVTNTTDGFVAIYSDDTADTGSIWYSTAWGSGWSQVATTRAVKDLAISRPVVDRTSGKTVLLVGEYISGLDTSLDTDLRASFDGGATWSIIHTVSPSDTAVNNHSHGSCYDPQMSRIWASFGDGANSFFGYSDDDGDNWTAVVTPDALTDPGGTSMQPVVVHPLGKRIAITPDRGDFNTGIWHVSKVGADTTTAHAVTDTNASSQFGNAPYAADGDEMYVLYPPINSGTNKVWMAGTADGGETWHNVYERTLDGDSFPWGVVGPDANGYLFVRAQIGGAQRILRGAPPSWIKS